MDIEELENQIFSKQEIFVDQYGYNPNMLIMSTLAFNTLAVSNKLYEHEELGVNMLFGCYITIKRVVNPIDKWNIDVAII